MSLFGALYSSVSGIEAQSTAISIISDNISNVNTTGYKAGSAYFDTLVTNSGSTVAYSPGGVRAQDKQLVTQQGLVQSTSSPTDMAISGKGFFVVQNSASSANSPTISYTRAGSFSTDSVGNFVNPAGLYLKAWPLDSDGNIPNNSASLASLNVVNIGSATGNATATSKVTAGANLDSTQTVFLGAGATAKPGADGVNVVNLGNNATDILVPNANLVVGDDLKATVNGVTNYTFRYGGFATSKDIVGAGPILGANNETDPFSGASASDAFTITRSGDLSNPLTFTYVASSPNTSAGQFDNLDTLAQAINSAPGMTARVATNAAGKVQLYVAAKDATQGLTFAKTAGSTGDFPTALALTTVAVGTAGTNRFASMDGLSTLINSKTISNITAKELAANTNTASLQINDSDPLTTLQFANVSNGGSSNFLKELGVTAAVIQPTYNGSNASVTSMASGNVTPAFQRDVTIYDSLGQSHDINIGFIKTANNQWQAEIYTQPGKGDTANGTNQIGSGKITFNSDGSLASISSSLTNIAALTWENGATSSNLSFLFGTPGQIGTGKTDGLRQFAGSYNVDFLNQNGSSAGLLNSVSVDSNGYIIANFTNGQTQKLYQIPLADFSDPNGLSSQNGNSYTQSFASGAVNLKQSGTGGVGTVSPSSLEGSNSDLSQELTNMIVAQRAYEASSKVITVADQLLNNLNQAISG